MKPWPWASHMGSEDQLNTMLMAPKQQWKFAGALHAYQIVYSMYWFQVNTNFNQWYFFLKHRLWSRLWPFRSQNSCAYIFLDSNQHFKLPANLYCHTWAWSSITKVTKTGFKNRCDISLLAVSALRELPEIKVDEQNPVLLGSSHLLHSQITCSFPAESKVRQSLHLLLSQMYLRQIFTQKWYSSQTWAEKTCSKSIPILSQNQVWFRWPHFQPLKLKVRLYKKAGKTDQEQMRDHDI